MTRRPNATQRTLWMTMARLVAHLSRRADRAVRDAEGITLSEMTLMGQVRALGGAARMVDLAGRLQLTRAGITKIVDSLEARACLRREPDPADRRVVMARITEEGKAVLGRAEAAFEAELFAGLWDRLSARETRTASALLGRVQAELGLPGGALMPP